MRFSKTMGVILPIFIILLFQQCFINQQDERSGYKDWETKLKSTPENEKRVDILNKLAYMYTYIDIDKGEKFAQEAQELTKGLNYIRGEADSLNNLGLIEYVKSNFKKANECFSDALKLSKQENYISGILMANIGIGRCHYMMGEYDSALDKFILTKIMCEIDEQLYKRQLAFCYYGIGALYYFENEVEFFPKQISYLKQSLNIREKIDDDYALTTTYYALGQMYLKEYLKKDEKIERVEYYFNKCEKLRNGIDDEYNRANLIEGRADILVKEKKDDKAEIYAKAEKEYKESMSIFEKFKARYQVAELRIRLGHLYLKWGKREKAKHEFQEAYRIATRNYCFIPRKKAVKYLADNFRESEIEIDGFADVQKEINDKINRNKMTQLKVISELESSRRNRLYLIAAASVLTVLILFVSVSHALHRKNLNILKKLNKIGKIITSGQSPKEVYDSVTKYVKELMIADVFLIYLLDESLNRLVYAGGKEGKEERMSNANRYFELTDTNRPGVKVFLNRKGKVYKNYPKEYLKEFGVTPPKPRVGETYKSHIFLPLLVDIPEKSGQKALGYITVQSSKKNSYRAFHENILRNVVGYAAIALENVRIIQEKEKALEKEKILNTHKDDYIHTVSHAYKTPLSIINNCAENLRDYLPKMSHKDIQKHFERIFSNISYIQDLVDDLLSFGEVFEPEQSNLNLLVKEVIDRILKNVGTSHPIEYLQPESPIVLMLSKKLMERVISEILVNAINYSDEGSTILVELKKEPFQAVLIFKDEGRGIHPEDLKIICERFHRGRNVKNIKGTGLGLTLVNRYIDLHKGKVLIQSELDKGTTVTIRLPLESPKKNS